MKKISVILSVLLFILAFAFVGCDKKETGEHSKAELAQIYQEVAEKAVAQFGYEGALESDSNSVAAATYSLSALPDEAQELTEPQDIANMKLVLATFTPVVNMIGEYYENENFIVTDKVVSFDINESIYPGEDIKISILSKLDEKNNKIYLEFYMSSTMSGSPSIEYDYCEIGYDFDGDKGVTSFLLVTAHTGIIEMVGEEKMTEDGKFYQTGEVSADYTAAVLQMKTDFESKIEQGEKLEGNFDVEFNNYLTNVYNIVDYVPEN